MTGSRRRAGPRRGRFALIGAIAATAVMAVGASSAQAAPVDFNVTFDDAVLSLPAPAGNSDILDPPDTAIEVGRCEIAGCIEAPDGVSHFCRLDGRHYCE